MTPSSLAQALETAVGHHQAGRLFEAESLYRQILAQWPDHADALHLLGLVALQTGHYEPAIELIGRAIAIAPGMATFHCNLGEAYRRAGQTARAIASFRRAIELAPGLTEAHCNLGSALKTGGHHEEAISAYRRAIELDPRLPEAHNNLGTAYFELGRTEEALASCRHALALNPDYGEAHCNVGNALKEQGKLDEAIEAYRRAIALRPEIGVSYNNLASALLDRGNHDEAIRAFDTAVAVQPEYSAAHSNRLLCEQYLPGTTLASLAQSHAEWERRHAAAYGASRPAWVVDRDPERPLRLGFVSPNLGHHPVGFFLARVLESLDRRSCTTVCYSCRAVRDHRSHRLAATAGEWYDVAGLNDDALAAKIRADRIDLLFDLAGHTADGRLLVFARRPAPVQVTWMGYVGTTGLKAMDYLIADRYHVPPEAEPHISETVLRMPDGYICYDAPAEAPAVGPLPALMKGHFTFGSFNNVSKLTPEVIALWGEIMRRVPGARLLLVSKALASSIACERIGAAFAAAGGDRERLELRGALPWSELLGAYNQVDLALDPFPYSGGLTTCEALWMGVPVVTWPGAIFASRHSLSHLSNVGLTETVTADRRDYVERAVRMAGDLAHLAALRAGLREQMGGSPLCDAPRFAGNLMAVLRDVWRQWCRR
jgi:predicted O-linked N-acetylglucosamine transferase (SPINDLY family)